MRTPKKIKFPEINKDLAYLCGVLTGDGHIGIRKNKFEYLINCGGNPKDEIEFYDEVIGPLFNNLFNIKVKPKLMSSNRIYGINIWSKELVYYLLDNIGLTKSPKINLNVPKIFYKDKQLLFSFISGVADTDFSFKLRKGTYPIISGSSKSKNLMEEISKILEDNNFKVFKYFDYKILDSRLIKGFNIINRIDLNGHDQFIRWIQLIGTRHPKNLSKIKQWKELNKNNPRIKKSSWTI